MRKIFPVEELARDDRFVRVQMIERMNDAARPAARTGRAGPASASPRPPARRRRRPRADARHLRRRDPGARGRRPHVLGLRDRHRPRGRRSSSSSTWPASAGTRPATARSRIKLGDWMGTEIGEYSESTVPLRGRLQPRPGAAPHRREPRARRPRHRRVQHDEGVRRDLRRPGPRVLRGLDARRRGDPREDGLRLAAPPHRERPRAARAGARVPGDRRQALLPRWLPRRGRRQPDPPGPPLPRAGRLLR